ncbi:MAG: hypothetical protein AB7L09_01570 [Nitrospira sp.]
MSRPTVFEMGLMQRADAAIARCGIQYGNQRKYASDDYVIRQWSGRTSVYSFTIDDGVDLLLSWDRTTKEIDVNRNRGDLLQQINASLERLLVLDELAGV